MQHSRMGDKGCEASDQIRKDEPRILCEDSEGGSHDLENETSLPLRNGGRMHVDDSGTGGKVRCCDTDAMKDAECCVLAKDKQVPCGTRLLGTGKGEREHQETNVSEAEDKRDFS